MTPDTKPIIRELVRSVFAPAEPLAIERVPEGVSTEVYRVRMPDQVYYLRILPQDEGSFAPEIYVHQEVRARQVQAPEVIYFAHRHPQLQRSVMITVEIPGRPVGHGALRDAVSEVIRAAGRTLAHIHTIPVQGFGWVLRQEAEVEMLRGEYATYAEWIEQEMAGAWKVLAEGQHFTARELDRMRRTAAEALDLFGEEPALLAHGDFDASHIYHQDGRLTGIIDFGEIRGANRVYDLGHFRNEDEALLPDLLEGYGEVYPLPGDIMRRIWMASLLIAVRRVGRRAERTGHVDRLERDAIIGTLQALERNQFV